MKSKKLFGILIILFVVHVWASDDQHNKENVDGTNKDHALNGENSEKKHDDENLETNPNKNKNIHDLIDKIEEEKSDDVNKDHDSIQQTFEQDDPKLKFKIDFEDDPNIEIEFVEINACITILNSIKPIKNSPKMNNLFNIVMSRKSENPKIARCTLDNESIKSALEQAWNMPHDTSGREYVVNKHHPKNAVSLYEKIVYNGGWSKDYSIEDMSTSLYVMDFSDDVYLPHIPYHLYHVAYSMPVPMQI
jgi:hypothetical protein